MEGLKVPSCNRVRDTFSSFSGTRVQPQNFHYPKAIQAQLRHFLFMQIATWCCSVAFMTNTDKQPVVCEVLVRRKQVVSPSSML